MAEQRKLKNILLIPQFQLKFLGYFLGLFFLTTASLYSTSYLFFWRLKQKALNVGIPDGHVFFKFVENQKSDLDFLFISLTLLNLFLLIGTGFIISHRIAGPLHKLKTYLGRLNPNSEDFRFREKDFFKDLEPVINDLRNRLK